MSRSSCSLQTRLSRAPATCRSSFRLPIQCTTLGLILSPSGGKGYRFTVMDVDHTDGDRVIQLETPERMYDLVALLRDNGRFVIESIHARQDGDIAVSNCTTRLRSIAGKCVGKDDPILLVRTQKAFPATGEVLAPFEIAHCVSGFMRGSHVGPLMPVRARSSVSFFDGPPIVSCLAFSISGGKLTEPIDAFDHPYWDWVREKAAWKAHEIRRQGFSGLAMLGIHDLEYVGISHRLDPLDPEFKVRTPRAADVEGRASRADDHNRSRQERGTQTRSPRRSGCCPLEP